jgi:hypothetical protein
VLSRSHCDELRGAHGYLLAINDDSASTANDGIDVLGSVVSVIVADSLPTWKLGLISPNARAPSACPMCCHKGSRPDAGPGAGFSEAASTVV